MSNSLSPGVETREFDASVVVSNASEVVCAMVGDFEWGPCFERTQVSSETDLLSRFGKPTDTNFKHWFSAANYFKYGNNLNLVRAIDSTTAKNAGIAVGDEDYSTAVMAIGTNPYIPNYDSIPAITFTANQKLKIVAKYPGIFGNTKIKVAISTADDFDTALIDTGISFKSQFEYKPLSNTYDKYDQLAIAVLVQNISDGNWSIVEKFIVDLDPDALDADNYSNYIENKINEKSWYIYVFDNTTIEKSPKSFPATLLAGGLDGTPGDADIQLGYDLYANKETFYTSMIIDGGNESAAVQQYIWSIADQRQDTEAIICIPVSSVMGVPVATAIANLLTWRTTTINKSSSYGSYYTNAKRITDKYNRKTRWIPMSSDMAGCRAFTSETAYDWFAPAGYRRGIIRNCERLAQDYEQAYRDTMYLNQLNPIFSDEGWGYVVLGQKTGLPYQSAFSRINVRRLFNIMKRQISIASKAMLFEQNSPTTRTLFINMVEPFLTRIQSLDGIYDFRVVCNTVNNTPQVIDNNEFVGDIYVKPTRTAEFIKLNFTAVGTGVSFEELIGGQIT